MSLLLTHVPPALLRLRIRRAPTLWLPLFLLWPLLLIALLLLFLTALVLARGRPNPGALAAACTASLWRTLCAARGTTVDVDAAQSLVRVSIY
jgi:hypothetical protein